MLLYGAATIGVVVALVTRGRSPLIPVVAVLLVMAAAIVVSVGYRWTWPWQRADVRESRRGEALLTAIVGPRLDPALAEAWLVRSPDAPISDRISILRWRGVAEVGAGQDLRVAAAVWSLQWLTVSFLITSVGLGVLSLVLAR